MADDIKFVIGVDDRDLIKAQKEQIKFQRNLVTIEKAYRKGDITASRYNAELAKQAKQLQALGGSYRTANSEVRKFAYQMRQADDATLAQTEAMAFAGKRVNRLGVNLQQAGYQIGDFAVQVQGGTNVMVALGQQGAQLAGIFGPAGAIAGAGLAITTAFLAPLMKVRDEAKKAADATEEFENKVKSLDKALRDYAKTKEAVSLGLTPDELTAQEALDKEVKALKEAKDALQEINDLISNSFKMGGGEAAAGLALGQLVGILPNADDVKAAEKLVVESEERIVELQAKIRQEAREKAEAILNQSYEESQRAAALAEYEAGQKVLAEREAWVNKAATIFRDAQKRLRDEEVALTERSLDRLFANRTLLYRIRFSGETDVMSQAVESSGKFKPKQSFEELVAMGYDPETLMGLGLKPKPKKKTSTGSKKADPLAELRKRITLEEQLFGKTEAQRQVMQALGVDYEKVYGKEATDQIIGRINKIKELQKEEDKLADIAQNIGSSFESAFTSMVDGTSSVKDAFRNMARDIVAYLFEVLVMQRAINSFGGMLSGSSNSIVSTIGSKLESYDGGGYTGSGPRSGGMDGRGGRLAMIHPQETVVDHTKANSGSGEQIVINQSFNFAANGDESVKKLIAQAAPQIANMTQKQIIDSRRRGGTMKSTFG